MLKNSNIKQAVDFCIKNPKANFAAVAQSKKSMATPIENFRLKPKAKQSLTNLAKRFRKTGKPMMRIAALEKALIMADTLTTGKSVGREEAKTWKKYFSNTERE